VRKGVRRKTGTVKTRKAMRGEGEELGGPSSARKGGVRQVVEKQKEEKEREASELTPTPMWEAGALYERRGGGSFAFQGNYVRGTHDAERGALSHPGVQDAGESHPFSPGEGNVIDRRTAKGVQNKSIYDFKEGGRRGHRL